MREKTSFKRTCIEQLEPRRLLTASLIADYSEVGLHPHDPIAIGDRLLFVGTTPKEGEQPWISDGTKKGTFMLKNVHPYSDRGSLSRFARAGDYTYFISTSPADEPVYQLWRTDGTSKGTLSLGSHSFRTGAFEYFADLDGVLVFADLGGLWRTDGTAKGTFKILSTSLPEDLCAAGKYVYFFASDDQGNTSFWRTDGTRGGTQILGDVGYSRGEFAVGDDLYFCAGVVETDLWRYNPDVGLVKLRPFASIYTTVNLKGDSWFMGQETVDDSDVIWRLRCVKIERIFADPDLDDFEYLNGSFLIDDGYRLLAMNPGNGSVTTLKSFADPTGPEYADLSLASSGFVLVKGTHNQLWKTDCTKFGTIKICDVPLKNGSAHVAGTFIADAGKRVFFDGLDGTDTAELWTSDGTDAGTRIVKDIRADPEDSSVDMFTAWRGKFLFTTSEDIGDFGSKPRMKIWTADGVTAPSLMATVDGMSTARLFPFGSRVLLVSGTDYAPSNTLSILNPRSGKVSLVKNGLPGLDFVGVAGSHAFFTAHNFNAVYGQSLWATDGTDAGTVMLRQDSNAPTDIEYFASPTSFGGKLYFTIGYRETGQLWSSDGTVAGTKKVRNWFDNSPIRPRRVGSLNIYKGAIYFVASDAEHGWGLWRTDETASAAQYIGAITDPSIQPVGMVAAKKYLYFFAGDAGARVYRSDGTVKGTHQIGQLASNENYNGYDGASRVAGNVAYFEISQWNELGAHANVYATDGTTGGSGVVPSDAGLGYRSFDLNDTTPWQGHLVSIENGVLRQTDGLLHTDLAQFYTGAHAQVFGGTHPLTAIGQRLFFYGWDEAHGWELWTWVP
jgi:ELWxxDGT repeat protein